MPKPPYGMHAFTFEGEVLSGKVHSASLVEGILDVVYEYVIGAIMVRGSFTAEQVKDGSFLGTWKETSQKPVDGQTAWQGTARLAMTESTEKRAFFGAWTMPRIDERWMLEVPL